MHRRPLYPLLLLFSLLLPGHGVRAGEAFIAIVIDDLGNHYSEGMRALELPGSVSFAILPHTPYSNSIARIAHILGRDVLVHMPMQAHSNRPLGPGGLNTAMSRGEFSRQVRAALRAVPHARGLSNHMGSLLTEQRQPMAWLMQILKQEQKLFFLDSRTSAFTQAARAANENKLPNTSRDVFLDNVLNVKNINLQFDHLIQAARQNGTAVAIGHPYPQTLEVLETRLPELKSKGIRLISLSRLIEVRRRPAGKGDEQVMALQIH